MEQKGAMKQFACMHKAHLWVQHFSWKWILVISSKNFKKHATSRLHENSSAILLHWCFTHLIPFLKDLLIFPCATYHLYIIILFLRSMSGESNHDFDLEETLDGCFIPCLLTCMVALPFGRGLLWGGRGRGRWLQTWSLPLQVFLLTFFATFLCALLVRTEVGLIREKFSMSSLSSSSYIKC